MRWNLYVAFFHTGNAQWHNRKYTVLILSDNCRLSRLTATPLYIWAAASVCDVNMINERTDSCQKK